MRATRICFRGLLSLKGLTLLVVTVIARRGELAPNWSSKKVIVFGLVRVPLGVITR